ncbi:MAG: GNAT family N-acetyltransferase [Promethearchaeota archaeon]
MTLQPIMRLFRPKDAEDCSFLMQDHFLNHAENLPLESRQNIAQARNKDYIQQIAKDRTIVVAIEKDKIVGMGALKENEIRHMYVLADFQYKGIGSAILRFLENEAKKKGLNSIFVYSVFYAEKFYQKHGFKVIKKDIIERQGSSLEAILMKKEL